ncbi:MAG: tRNA pseudouridine(38-40) synthase TruA, partial [Nitrospirae bacterium]|nr:tRNA pseudouridine(38-40) synthase TruA [Nitrospirota bacterium]
MRKIRLTLQYDGTAYAGWQFQPDAPSIQGAIEAAIAKVTGEQVRVTGAGRTDAGVHALGQVAAFRSSSRLKDDVMLRALNASLPHDIRIVDAVTADDSFHPRKDAVGKKYVYLIQNRRIPSVFLGRWTWFVPLPLDLDAMREGLLYLVGRHDFSSFRTSGGDAVSPVRTINSINISRDEKTE